jgi:penicillin-binding protein 1A
MRRKIIKVLWGSLLGVVAAVVLFFTAIANGWIGYVPPIEELENPISRYASQVLSADNVLLGTWSLNENRVFVPHDEIAPSMMQALIATEDKRFYEHNGIDFRSLGRAIVKRGLLGRKGAGGGSTITQQLAKQLYTASAGSTTERLLQKTIEWVIAVKLERYYSKDEILTLYLNYFDFLHHAVGIKSAAKIYFNKTPKELTVAESAMLVGMCKNPSYYNPIREPDRVLDRRNVVLGLMRDAGYLSNAECEEFQKQPLGIHFQRVSHKEGLATYLREYLRRIMMAKKPVKSQYNEWQAQQYHDDSIAWESDPLYGWCNKNFKKDGSPYNIYTDGLKVYTSIDSRLQRYAEDAVREHMAGYLQPEFEKEKGHKASFPFSSSLTPQQIKDIIHRNVVQSDRYRLLKQAGLSDEEIDREFRQKVRMSLFTYQGDVDTLMSPLDSILYYKSFLRTGFMAMDPETGAVKAYVGGIDYASFQYDMCMTGRRQIGSTIKPYLYSLAMENGYSPCDVAPNVQRTYIVAGKPWTPRNTNKSRYGQQVTLKWGLSQSNNWISAYLMSKLNPHALLELLRTFGINSLDIHPSMSLCLGPCDISVGEMVSAYTAFVGSGIRVAPLFVTKIEDNTGEVVTNFSARTNEVISAESSYKMLDMLKAVIDHGTGRRLRSRYHFTGEIAGKTGTTNNNSDGWFIGMIPTLVAGCWVGGENRDIHFDNMSQGQGASMALPIWAKFMNKVYSDKSLGYSQEDKFKIPDDFEYCATTLKNDTIVENGIDEIFQ